MDDGIVFARHRGVAGGAFGDHVHICGNFFADLHADVLRLAVFQENAAAFVDGVAGGDFVPVLIHGEQHAGGAVGFFIAFGEEDDVAIEVRAGAFQFDEDGEIGGEHAFVVNGAAAVEVAVFYDCGEGIFGPFGFVHADYVEVSHQEQGAGRIGHGAGGEASDDESAAGSAFENFRGDAFFGEDGGDIFCGYQFVAWGIGGVDAQQALQPAERVNLNLGERRIRAWTGIAATWERTVLEQM